MNPEDIDINAPGGIDALLAFHRSIFGSARMEGEADGDKPADGGKPADGDKPADGGKPAESVDALPAWAQKVIADARKEAADNRVGKTSAEKAAAEAKAIVDSINSALNPGAAADPTKLAEQLAAAQAKQRDADVRLAVFLAASTAGANPTALLDRNSFNKALEGLDPTSADFSTKVTEAITAAVTADPTLKAAQAVGASAADHKAGGSGEGGSKKPVSLDAAVKDHYGA